jgi:hypothetical protein
MTMVAMDHSRIFLNILFWIVFSFAFDAVSSAVFPDLSMEATIFLWFIGLCIGTLLINVSWYWLRLRQR